MIQLLQNLFTTFLESFQTNIPEITRNWFILTKILFYAGAIFVYVLTFVVLISVALIIFIIAVPVSIIYKILY